MGADNYTVKEMVTELRKENKLGISTQAIILTKIENMETQMKEIIAQNAIRNGRLEKLETKMAYMWGGIALLSALGVNNLVTWAGM
jgi:hypothetical protein